MKFRGGIAAHQSGYPVGACTAEIVLPVRPRDVNVMLSVFGGYVMELVDRAASLAASRFASTPVVTASLGHLDFLSGLKAYQLIRLRARGTRTFRTSMVVWVDVEGEDPASGRRWPTSQATVTLVSLGGDGRLAPFPPLVAETVEQRAAWEAAGRRRAERRTDAGDPEPSYDQVWPQSGRHLSTEMSTEPVMPECVNELGLATAGWLLSVGDKLAGITAARHSGRPAVTAAVHSVSFAKPIRMADVVVFKTFVTRAFSTSMEVRCEVWKRSPFSGDPEHVSTWYSTFVALGEDGRPAAVAPVEPRNDFERTLYEAAGRRRALRDRRAHRGRPPQLR